MAAHRSAAELAKSRKSGPRRQGVPRPYSAEDVVRLRGTFHIEHTLARILDEKPRVFIGSSTEGLHVAELIQLRLEHAADCTVWTQSTFSVGRTAIESLVDATTRYGFAVFVLTPDDLVVKRGTASDVPRDNLLFELGLFTGALGRDRVFMVVPRDRDMSLPSDLIGVTAVAYSQRSDGNMEAALGPACTRIKQAIGLASWAREEVPIRES